MAAHGVLCMNEKFHRPDPKRFLKKKTCIIADQLRSVELNTRVIDVSDEGCSKKTVPKSKTNPNSGRRRRREMLEVIKTFHPVG